jgi:hypothetical protein
MAPAAQAQTVPAAPAVSDPDALANDFFDSLKLGKTDVALKILATGSAMLGKKIEENPQLETQIDRATEVYGPVVRWERVHSETLGTMVRRDTYLVQHREIVTRWRFVYVRKPTGWIVGWFVFEDQMQNWFTPDPVTPMPTPQ